VIDSFIHSFIDSLIHSCIHLKHRKNILTHPQLACDLSVFSTNAKKLRQNALHNLGKSRKIIIGTQIAMIVTMALALIGTSFTGIILIAYASLPFPLICAFLYVRGARQMTDILGVSTELNGTAATNQSTKVTRFVKTLNKVTRRIVFCNLYFITGLIAYALTQGDSTIRELSVAGQWFTFEKFAHHSNFLALVSSTFVVWDFLRSTTRNDKTQLAATSTFGGADGIGTFEYSQDGTNEGSFRKQKQSFV
jgi:hypothetical protein